MMRAPLTLLLCALAGPALALPAVPFLPAPRDVCRIQIPPARYDHAPRGRVDIRYAPAASIAQACVKSGEDHAVGCTTAVRLGRVLVGYDILIANRPTAGNDPRCTVEKWRASILRHERAHAAGWPADHPR